MSEIAPMIMTSRAALAKELWSFGEDDFYQRATDLTDAALLAIGKRAMEITTASMPATADGASMPLGQALALAAVEFYDGKPRLLRRNRRRPQKDYPGAAGAGDELPFAGLLGVVPPGATPVRVPENSPPRGSQHVYDKAKYHADTVEELCLSPEHAAHHTLVFLRWLIERRLMSDRFERETKDLAEFRAGHVSIHKIYEWWDDCLVEDMLSDEGNAFAIHYFDFDRGQYGTDYVSELQGGLPSLFCVDYSEDNYQRMRKVIDRRHDEWRKPKKSWWRR